jgi:hypothetical protein
LLIGEVDFVVSVDTAVAHLAGAMGRTTMVLVPGFGVDWRWIRGKGGHLSPWYRNHRLFRGHYTGAWNAALDRLQGYVGELTKGPPPPT